MAFKLRAFGRDIIIGKRLYGVGREQDFFAVQQKFGNWLPAYKDLDYYKGIVYACISAIAEEVANYDPKLKRLRGDQYEDVNSHPFLDLLNNPQPDEPDGISRYDLFEATQSFIELTGEAFWYIPYGEFTRRPKAIHILRPDRMGVDIDDEGNVKGYFLRRMTGDPIPFEVEEIIHFKMFNPKNPYRGLGTIQAGIDYVETDEFSTKFTRNFFRNNAGVTGVLNIKGEVSKNAFQKFVRAWRDKYEGVDSAGKTAIVRESEAEFTKIGLGLDELDMKALKDMTVDQVLMMFRVPRPMVGLTTGEGLGRGNVETFEYIFTKRTVEPKMRRIDSMLQKAFERYFPGDAGFIISHENIIPSDKTFELEERVAAVDMWKTRDEIRDEEGLDPVPGGSELRAPMASLPLSIDITDTEATEAKSTGLTMRIKRKAQAAPEPPAVQKDDLPVDNKEAFRLRLMRNQIIYERRYLKKIKPVLNEQLEEALYNLEAKASSLTKDHQEQIFDEAKAEDEFAKALLPVLFVLLKQQGDIALVFAGDDESEFKITPAMEKYVSNSTQKMARNFNIETIKSLNQTLSEGVLAGESLGKLKKRVEDVYSKAKGFRAERIARTETLKASNKATVFAYKQTGYVTAKKWYANPGHCEMCAEMDGKIVGLDEEYLPIGSSLEYEDANGEAQTYQIDYDDVAEPPLHPNCACAILPVREAKALSKTTEEVERLKTEKEDLLKAVAKDKIYIKELENHLGVDDEPPTEA